MLLRDYLEKYKPNMTKFAASCDTDIQSIYAYKNGNWKPKQPVAERIEKQTDGLVTVMELRGKDDRTKRRKTDDNTSEQDVRGEIPSSGVSGHQEGEIKGFV